MTTSPDIYGSAIPPRSDARAFTAYAAAVMAAAEYEADSGFATNVEYDACAKWMLAGTPQWDWNNKIYRIAPSSRPKRFVTWRGPDDVPKGPAVWLRRNGEAFIGSVVTMSQTGVRWNESLLQWHHLSHFEWSPDRIVWADCTVEVES